MTRLIKGYHYANRLIYVQTLLVVVVVVVAATQLCIGPLVLFNCRAQLKGSDVFSEFVSHSRWTKFQMPTWNFFVPKTIRNWQYLFLFLFIVYLFCLLSYFVTNVILIIWKEIWITWLDMLKIVYVDGKMLLRCKVVLFQIFLSKHFVFDSNWNAVNLNC